ncbi:Dihydrofolate reductase [Promicromonospora umidemergens]|uniref:Dihydrofolate reductase family protein n=1 Tax=Promicromonospora umidemergens TaxID=629679 RepID=A0ABP8Y7F7_9MICO|nr:dihydrofolate reductase family protein [Promicromonospora umidemergens]MCP2282507.1 Dihydrofolate reductase [Promicromonospora umidemergens]
MAKLSSSMFISLDGVVEVGEGEWHFPYFDEPMGEAVTRTHAPPRMIFGRVTYDSFAGAWPEREQAGEDDAQMAKDLGDKRKYVLSRSPLEFTWRNSEQLTGDFVDAVTALKQEEGDIFLSGSPSVVRQLLRHGLLDELNLFVHPVLAGKGERLFPVDGPTTHLKLVSSEAFPRGVQLMVFEPTEGAPDEVAYEEVREHLAND